tara:strand:+ start:974 stop:2884 length:1911 start_codon:yes stop_codon:yes gene_type:complete
MNTIKGSLLSAPVVKQEWIKKKMQEAMDSKTFLGTPLANMIDHEGYSLAAKGYQRFVEFLGQEHVVHNPSIDERLGVLDLAMAIEAQAREYDIDPVQLSSLSCGVGKTTMIKFMLLEILASDLDVGAVICLARNQSVINLAKEIEEDSPELFNQVAIYTSTMKISEYGSIPRQYAHKAPVVITTQQHLNGKQSKDVAFNYKGRPRQVTIWDEAFRLGDVSELSVSDICLVSSSVSKLRIETTDILKDLNKLTETLSSSNEDDVIDIFNFSEQLALMGKESYLSTIASEEIKEKAKTLWELSGRQVSVANTINGKVVLRYEETIPEQLLPIVITDASGVCSHIYKLMSKYKYKVCNRHTASRDNSDITFHVWNIGSGRGNFKFPKEVERRAEGFSKTLKDIEDTSLIFHFKEMETNQGVLDFPKILRDYTGKNDNHHYLQYGYHTSTNQYRHIRNIFMFGSINIPPSSAKGNALLHSDDKATKADINLLRKGEFLSDLLQSVYRGNGRNSIQGKSGKCDVYLMMSQKQGYLSSIKELFRGAKFVDWNCTSTSLATRSIDLIQEKIDTYKKENNKVEGFEISIADITQELECSRQHFTRVRNDEDFSKYLAENDLSQVGKTKQPTDKNKSHISYHFYF